MKEFITKNFTFLIATILLGIIILQQCRAPLGRLPINTSDTVQHISYNYIKDSSTSKPIFIQGKRDTLLESSVEYIPSQDYDELKQQFQELKEQLLSQNVYKDIHKVDTFGTVEITDTVQRNTIIGRKYVDNIIIPTKTITITNTIYPKAKGQLYFGGGISATQQNIQSIDMGLMYKTKNDKLIGAKAGVDLNGNFNFGVSTYWKIHLGKN